MEENGWWRRMVRGGEWLVEENGRWREMFHNNRVIRGKKCLMEENGWWRRMVGGGEWLVEQNGWRQCSDR